MTSVSPTLKLDEAQETRPRFLRARLRVLRVRAIFRAICQLVRNTRRRDTQRASSFISTIVPRARRKKRSSCLRDRMPRSASDDRSLARSSRVFDLIALVRARATYRRSSSRVTDRPDQQRVGLINEIESILSEGTFVTLRRLRTKVRGDGVFVEMFQFRGHSQNASNS